MTTNLAEIAAGMDFSPEEIQHIIYEYKHQLEFCDVVTHIEFQFARFCPSCGQGISFCFGKRCKCLITKAYTPMKCVTCGKEQ